MVALGACSFFTPATLPGTAWLKCLFMLVHVWYVYMCVCALQRMHPSRPRASRCWAPAVAVSMWRGTHPLLLARRPPLHTRSTTTPLLVSSLNLSASPAFCFKTWTEVMWKKTVFRSRISRWCGRLRSENFSWPVVFKFACYYLLILRKVLKSYGFVLEVVDLKSRFGYFHV